MDPNEVAQAINKNAMTEAEAVGENRLVLTLRPKDSSRVFTATVEILQVKEV